MSPGEISGLRLAAIRDPAARLVFVAAQVNFLAAKVSMLAAATLALLPRCVHESVTVRWHDDIPPALVITLHRHFNA